MGYTVRWYSTKEIRLMIKKKIQTEQLLTISCKGEQRPVAEWQALTFQINQFVYSDINLLNICTAKCEHT